jgi:hypothetical protein
MFIILYLLKSCCIVAIAQLLGCSRWMVTRLMHDLDVPIRKHVGQPLPVDEQKQ